MARFDTPSWLVVGFALLVMTACRARPIPPATAVPNDSEIPHDALGASMWRGRALLVATRDSLPAHVGNALRCTSCHLDVGRRDNGSWIGVFARFPQYRSRRGAVELIEDRINDCFKRSMNGTPLPPDGPEMRDIVAYLAFLSWRTPTGRPAAASNRLKRFESLVADTAAGLGIYQSGCRTCHGDAGEGTTVAPPLWGPQSYNIGAGMARVRTAASFIRDNMPFDRPGTLTDQQALDVAAFVNGRPRPDYPGKELDWPNGDPPPDVAYPTRAAARAPRAP